MCIYLQVRAIVVVGRPQNFSHKNRSCDRGFSKCARNSATCKSTTPRQVRQYKQSRANERGQIQRIGMMINIGSLLKQHNCDHFGSRSSILLMTELSVFPVVVFADEDFAFASSANVNQLTA